MTGDGRQVVLGQVTVRCDDKSAAAAGRVALRLRAESLVARVDLQPPGLPPGAILVVRQLQARARPGLAGWAGGGPAGEGAGASALRRQVEALYRSARRPAQGVPPSGAASVVFTDEAELLACLTRDVLAGSAWGRWYWQQILRLAAGGPGPVLAAVWSGRAAALPAALAQLTYGEAVRALALLAPAEVARVAHALGAAFDLPDPGPGAGVAHSLAGDGQPGKAPPLAGALRAPGGQVPPQGEVMPPWRPWLAGRVAARLAPPAERLLGLCLALAHAPAHARTQGFAARTAAWLRAQQGYASDARAGSADEAIGGRTGGPAGVRPAPSPPTGAEAFRPTRESSVRRGGSAAMPGRAEGAPGGAAVDAGAVGNAPRPLPALATPAGRDAGPAEPSVRDALGEPQPASPALEDDVAPAAVAAGWPEGGVDTELGGALFLVNLATYLGLPGGWPLDGNRSLAEYLGGWAVVEALAHGLLGRARVGARFAGDPLWAILAGLDRRPPGRPLGAGLPAATFRLPPACLRRLQTPPDYRWGVVSRGRRLLIWDASGGYRIVDVPCQGEPAAAATTEIAPYATAPALTEDPAGPPPLPRLGRQPALAPGTAWWLLRVLGFVQVLLARALGLPDAGAARPGELLLVRPGRLQVTRTHVDLYLPAGDVSLAVRHAGLDADPGWTPDLGRIVSYHYV